MGQKGSSETATNTCLLFWSPSFKKMYSESMALKNSKGHCQNSKSFDALRDQMPGPKPSKKNYGDMMIA